MYLDLESLDLEFQIDTLNIFHNMFHGSTNSFVTKRKNIFQP